MSPLERSKRINLHATAQEQDMLRALADRDGLSMSDYLRQLIRRQHAATFGEQPATSTKTRTRKRK